MLCLRQVKENASVLGVMTFLAYDAVGCAYVVYCAVVYACISSRSVLRQSHVGCFDLQASFGEFCY